MEGGGHIADIEASKRGFINVFVFGGNLPAFFRGAWGEGGASTILSLQKQKYAFSFLGLNETDTHLIEHEFAHHFIGNTLGATSSWKNAIMDWYINYKVLPHIQEYGNTMRTFAQQVLNP